MRRIIFGLITILGAGAVIASGVTGAFFSDTETSTGNTFAAGAIDLLVDNESYYNGNKCTDVDLNLEDDIHVWQWQGSAAYPVAGTACTTSWTLDDLDNGLLFFNFTDIKPDDESEDTISLHVQNEAWACMDVSLTSNDDRSSTEPELSTPDTLEDINNTWDGELAQNLQFFWWADDGDNVYEENENTISGGVRTLYNLATSTPFSVALADSTHNVWGTSGPLPAEQTVYIAKAWCFGTLTLNPVAASQGVNPSVASGVNCDGTSLNNLTQTDGATLDVAFRAVQARHNADYLCNEEEPRLATLTVIKQITNNNGGNNVVADFQLFAVNSVVIPLTSGVPTVVAPDTYMVTESGIGGYQAIYSGDCDVSGQITLTVGDNKTCTITNDDISPSITLIKNVAGTPPLAFPVQFTMRVDGTVVPQNTSYAVTANTPHAITEDAFAGYTLTGVSGAACPLTLPGNVSLNEGQAIICTVTNTKNP
ncbi:MAG: hypothetical protein A2664_04835 [Candidatus Taylorbacteria bacterium RIFCSPHIGHO2_01_FULL_46_22b]|uniref:SpaA-like prealbumin fold domain-containing protein n=1 Tax=Candidatus Taylorbacteria bacterium RIFCSPHIGHO2_01_FULL_46_22b TaxID=1802301 RepID=A0A1G2M6V9_9BACT|nr:MAG: hypothetical protein A2664_04835 [Candidatus Taylorbacteria bacterium RIFCSPHIGHO2_01_FULL_46_22b]